MNLSVVLSAYNEEKTLDKCLASVKGLAFEIVVVVDQNTTDNTEKIARQYTKKIYPQQHDDNFHKLKKIAISKATGDWILQLDGDEIVTPALLGEIKDVLKNNPSENGFWIPRANYFLGRFLKKGGAYPDYTLRLYRRGKGDLPAKSVHEQAMVEGKIGYLKNNLLHFNNPTFGDYIEKRFNRYTDIMARQIQGGLFRNVFWEPLFNKNQGFLSIYIRHLGFFDGFPGFVWALFSALHFPIAYFKSIDIHEGRAS